MVVPRITGPLAVLVLIAAGCGGGPELKRERLSLSVKVSHKRYKPIHTDIVRKVTSAVVKDRALKLIGVNNVQREEALADLVAFGRQQPKACDLIVTGILGHPQPQVREYALLALAKVGPGDWRIPVDKFRRLINDRDDRVKCATLYAMGLLGVKDGDLVNRAFEYLADPSPSIRTYAAEAIRKLSYWPAIPALIYGHLSRAKAPSHIRMYAWEALENITLEKVKAYPRGADLDSILLARAEAWTDWWEQNRHKFGG
ncbi:MAG: HEAT repeat domain-containing protein [Planctomycetota bacterium]|jgi:hypothetical protein